MTIRKKIKTIDNKIQKNKAQYDLDKQIAKTLALSSGNVSKYEFLTGEDALPKMFLERAAIIKEAEYSPLLSELKKQKDIAKININF